MDKHVAFLLPDIGGGGAERLTIDLIGGFLARGARVDLVLQRRVGELMPLVPPEVRIVDLAATRIRGALAPLRRYLRQERPDALLAAMWPITVLAVLASAGLKHRPHVVISDHCALREQYAGQPVTLAAMWASMGLVYRFADAVVGVSNGVSAELAELAGMARERVTTVYNPVGPPLTSGVEPDSLWPVRRGRRILNVGSLKAQKNHMLLLDAFARLAREEPDAMLAIIGTGELRVQIEGEVVRLGLGERVIMPGFCATPGDWYAGADLFALSSDYEGLPLVLIEALHCGLSIVTTDCPHGPREILGESCWGRLVPVGNAEALAEAMQAALALPVDGVVQRARANEYSLDRAVNAYAALMLAAGSHG